MKEIHLTVLSIVFLAGVMGCNARQNKVEVWSYAEQDGWVAEQSEPEWYMRPEYHPAGEIVIGECGKWVIKCLKDFESIKPGVTRQEIMRKFPMDGGIQGVSTVRFVHPECRFFKVDVSFSFERNPNDQNRVIMGKDDKVIEVSKPYIENPYYD